MRNKVANLLRLLADKISPQPVRGCPVHIKVSQVEFKRFCVGHALPKGQPCLNFDYLRPNLARLIGEHLLKEKMIYFSIDDMSKDKNIIRAEVFAARPLDEDFQ